MNEAKIRLSKKEMALLMNADWILTKNGLIQKVKKLLEGLQIRQEHFLRSAFSPLPADILKPTPKISKGENYQGLPYVILDYPRFFSKDNIFAIRTLFWWGNFFSITLHLSGAYKKRMEHAIISAYPQLKKSGFHYCIHEEQWEHHFGESNYAPVDGHHKKDFEKKMKERSFIKLAKNIPLSEWENAEELLFSFFEEMVQLAGVLPEH